MLESLQTPSLVVVEAAPGDGRQELLARWLREGGSQAARTWHVTADFNEQGPWAGLRGVLADLLGDIEQNAPELLERHSYELCTILPMLRHKMEVRGFSLTDVARGDEKVRHYPPDRAFRVVQGVINLLTTWRALAPAGRWVFVFDAFEHASTLGKLFVSELLRRRGQSLQVTVVLAVAPGTGEEQIPPLQMHTAEVSRVRLDLAPSSEAPMSPATAARLAEELEQRMAKDPAEHEAHLPAVLKYWKQSQRDDMWRKSLALALNLAIHRGTYADAMRYGAGVLGELDLLAKEAPKLYRSALFSLMYGYIAAGEPARALQIVMRLDPGVESPETCIRLDYNLAMLHSRFLPQPDYDRAERYLQDALKEIERSSLPEGEKHFAHVFNRNGLAYVRMRQRRPQEAIELCKQGFERLSEHLHPERHKLHRSVLLYNIAQVYAGLDMVEQAISQITLAMEMDPNYSEYYNERGSLFLKSGRPDKALADFRKAIDCSPPYAEVWINLAQCYRAMNRPQQAVQAFSEALDLAPNNLLALRGRADCHDDLGLSEQAIADYSAALALSPAQPGLLANRAILRYASGQIAEAAADLDAAIRHAPQMADLYRNRAIALFDLGREEDAVRDCQTYLRMAPEAEDRQEIEARLHATQRARATG
ncbi:MULTISPECIES: tetratricopeptide repeat protein [unclassified Corallococcus]|uniref:tetratricopeptide repeat protein n=1 Tax=unclassified Corallococcus TaxID=2685029 RepID=UPI001A8FE3C9|nr:MULTISPECIES: tetratricopeptide repeat protein [unclassified Corallococcus]MBN9682610.1 tetratricopeptide repeat protein [Corallococcus sp. NCSPR001]WAS85844.1 tetratricopeptide repeat protein [Corallococcus sp. NCRR]